jgi:hypothetical protein
MEITIDVNDSQGTLVHSNESEWMSVEGKSPCGQVDLLKELDS